MRGRTLRAALAPAATINYHLRLLVAEALIMASILDLCRALPVQTFESGADLLNEGKTSGLLYVLISGEVEILKGNFQINVVSDPGAIFGEMSALLEYTGQRHGARNHSLQRARGGRR